MADINNRRFASTIAAGTTGTTFVSADGSFVASDVGRCIVISQQSSPAFGQIRKITGQTNSTTVTIDYAWDISPYRAERAGDGSPIPGLVEVNPAIGESFIVSVTLAEVAAANADLELVADAARYYRTSGVLTFTDGTFVYDIDCIFETDFQDQFRMTTGNTGFSCFRLGDVSPGSNPDANGYTSSPCKFIDTSVSFISDAHTTNAHVHMYGTFIECTGLTFWRMYSANSGSPDATSLATRQRQVIRFYQCHLDGGFGGRVAGDKSLLLDLRVTGANTHLGPFNPVALALVKSMAVRDCRQALYHYPEFAGDITVSGLTFDDISDRLVRIDGTNSNNSNVLTLNNIDVAAAQVLLAATPALTFVQNEGGRAGNRTEIVQDFNISLQTPALQPFASNTRLVVADANNSIVSNTSTSAGAFNTIPLEYGRVGGSTGRFDLTDFTLSAPYTYHIFSDNQSFIGASEGLTSPGVDITYTMTPDVSITESDVAVVSAYTRLDTAARLYDYQWRFKNSEPALPSLTGFFFRRSGDEVIAETDFNVLFVTDFGFPFLFTGNTLRVSVSTEGYTSGINVGTNNVTFTAPIRGAVTAQNILHNFTSGTIIDTPAAINGTLTLPAGSYVINGASIGGLTINRSGSEGTVAVVITGTSGTATAGTGVTITAPALAATRLSISVANVLDGAQYALWREFTNDFGLPITSGVKSGSTTINLTTNPAGETIDGAVYTFDTAVVNDHVFGVASTTGGTTFTGFTVVANTALEPDTTVNRVSIGAQPDQSANIDTLADVTGRSITVPDTRDDANRIQFQFFGCRLSSRPSEAQVQRLMAESRQASQNYLRQQRHFLAGFGDGVVITRDSMQFANGAVNMAGDHPTDGPAAYILTDNNGVGIQVASGVYDASGFSFTPRDTEDLSSGIETPGKGTDTPQVISGLRRIGLTASVITAQTDVINTHTTTQSDAHNATVEADLRVIINNHTATVNGNTNAQVGAIPVGATETQVETLVNANALSVNNHTTEVVEQARDNINANVDTEVGAIPAGATQVEIEAILNARLLTAGNVTNLGLNVPVVETGGATFAVTPNLPTGS